MYNSLSERFKIIIVALLRITQNCEQANAYVVLSYNGTLLNNKTINTYYIYTQCNKSHRYYRSKKKNHTQTSESVKEKISQSCHILCEPTDYTGRDILQARILERVASSLLQGIFPTERSNPSLLHSWWILYQLSHQTSPRILEWVAYPFPRGSSQPRNRTGASYLAGRFFTS